MDSCHRGARTFVPVVVLLVGIVAVAHYGGGSGIGNDHHMLPPSYAIEGPGPPDRQVEAGTAPEDVICREGYVLAIRTSQAPVCVTPGTAESLSMRGVIESIIGYTPMHKESVPDAGTSSVHTNQGGQEGRAIDGKAAGHGIGIIDLMQEEADYGSTDIGEESAKNETAGKHQPAGGADSGSDRTIPASPSSIVNFYITDHDLNTAPNAAETVATDGLLRFSISGTPIAGPKTMVETGPDTGKFYVRLVLPAMIDGRPLGHNDTVDITYLDQADRTGQRNEITKSFTLSSTYAQVQSEGDGRKRIGHEFTLRVYDPDSNTDSKEEDRIHLSRFEFRSEGNARATLDHRAFDANRSHMVETGPDTGIFEVVIKIPRQIDDKVIHIGDWYEITYYDHSTPSGTSEEMVLRGKIGMS